jgi:hypothetical protein
VSARERQIIEQAIGPAPWYYRSFPAVTGAGGQEYAWSFHGSQGPNAYLITLDATGDASNTRLALNTYCRPFPMDDGHIGIWCPEGKQLRIVAFDVDALAPFSLNEIAGWFKQSNDRIYAATPPIAELTVDITLPPGTHSIQVPEEFRSIDELLMVSYRPVKEKDEAAFALFVGYLSGGLVEVIPQNWFTAAQYDVGQQWIARVARDPETHRIVGEGVRVGTFELTEDSTQIARWLDHVA